MIREKDLPQDAGCNWEISSLNPANSGARHRVLGLPDCSPILPLAMGIQHRLLNGGWFFHKAVDSKYEPSTLGLVYRNPSKTKLQDQISQPRLTRNPEIILQHFSTGIHGKLGLAMTETVNELLAGTNLGLLAPAEYIFGSVRYKTARRFLVFPEEVCIATQPGLVKLSLHLGPYTLLSEQYTQLVSYTGSEKPLQWLQQLKERTTNNPIPLFPDNRTVTGITFKPMDT